MKYEDGGNERIRKILSLEKKYPVETWTVNDIHLWPYLRTYLYIEMWIEAHGTKSLPVGNTSVSPAKKEEARPMSIGERIKSLLRFGALYMTPWKKSDILFSSSRVYHDQYSGKTYHKFFDPIRLENEGSRHARIVYTGQPPQYRKAGDLLMQDFFYVQHLFARRYRKKGFVRHLDRYEDFYQEVSALSIAGRRLSARFLEDVVTRMEQYAFIYRLLAKKSQAKELISTCYYQDSLEFFGMNLAAWRLGLRSSDIQHGGQGILHLAYAQFFKLPKSGYYEILPSHFWCWDEHSAQEIRQWTSDQKVRHRVEVKGHPWLQFIRKKEKAQHRGKPIVLYCLQPFDEMISPGMIACIQQTSGTLSWILRLHPRMAHRTEELRKLIADHGLESAIHQETFSPRSLPETLAESAVQVTRTSGTVIEAALMGVPTLIIDPAGVAGFAAYVASGEAVDATSMSTEELSAELLRLSQRS